MHPTGTKVVVDKDTRDGRMLAQLLAKKGLDPSQTVMVVTNNTMVEAGEGLLSFRKIPHIFLTLPNGEQVETEPVALSRAS